MRKVFLGRKNCKGKFPEAKHAYCAGRTTKRLSVAGEQQRERDGARAAMGGSRETKVSLE